MTREELAQAAQALALEVERQGVLFEERAKSGQPIVKVGGNQVVSAGSELEQVRKKYGPRKLPEGVMAATQQAHSKFIRGEVTGPYASVTLPRPGQRSVVSMEVPLYQAIRLGFVTLQNPVQVRDIALARVVPEPDLVKSMPPSSEPPPSGPPSVSPSPQSFPAPAMPQESAPAASTSGVGAVSPLTLVLGGVVVALLLVRR